VSAIQVKNVPADLHDELRRRAAAEGKTVGEVILEALRRDLRRQSLRTWLDGVHAARTGPALSRAQVLQTVRESRQELFEEDALDERA
jgi:plasmid stability protein